MSVYKTCGIYGIKNKTSGKIYIGQTRINFGDRRDCHLACLRGGYHHNSELQKDWNEMGEDNFEFIIIEECEDISNEELNELEISYIDEYTRKGVAYNVSPGGDKGCFYGKHLPDEVKKKIGEKNRVNMTGKKASDKTKAKMSESHRKRYSSWTDEDRAAWGAKMSECQKGRKKPKLSGIMKGNKRGAIYTPEQVKEIRRLREEEGLEYTAISQIMNIPRGTIYNIATYRRWADI